MCPDIVLNDAIKPYKQTFLLFAFEFDFNMERLCDQMKRPEKKYNENADESF